MDGFARRKEQSKEDIRKAAWELFSQFGVDKVSIADIARKANVSQATIYNNFGSKQALTREFVTTAVEQLVNRVQEIFKPEMSYLDKMSIFIEYITEIIVSGRPSAADRALFTNSNDLKNDPEIKKIRDQAQQEMIRLLMTLVHEGKEQGQVDPDISEEVLIIYLAAFMDMFTEPELLTRFYQNPKQVKVLGSMMLNGLRHIQG